MSEVKRYYVDGREWELVHDQSGDLVMAADFDAEHALRLEAEREVSDLRTFLKSEVARSDAAERQVGELRTSKEAVEFNLSKIDKSLLSMQAKLDTAMEFLTDIDNWLVCSAIATPEDMAQSFGTFQKAIAAFINTTSTEDKDHG